MNEILESLFVAGLLPFRYGRTHCCRGPVRLRASLRKRLDTCEDARCRRKEVDCAMVTLVVVERKKKRRDERSGKVVVGVVVVVVLRTSRVYYYGLRHGMGADMEGTMDVKKGSGEDALCPSVR